MEWTQMPGSTARADYHRDQFGWVLQQAELPGLYGAAYAGARRLASVETGIALTRFPAENPRSMEEALAHVPPEPAPHGAKRQKKA